MKKLLVLILLTPFTLFAQSSLKEKLVGEWIKTDIRLKDGSAIYNPQLTQANILYIFQSDSYCQTTFDGRTSIGNYRLRGDSLFMGKTSHFKIEKLTNTQLVLQLDTITSTNPYKLFFEPAPLHNVGFIPETYITKGNDTIFVAKRNILEPYFLNDSQNILEFIYANFEFPEYKKGQFTLRFIITNKGEVKAPKILASNQEKYNDRLLRALQKTQGKWLPAKWEGKTINAEMELFFDMKPADEVENASASKGSNLDISEEYFQAGTEFLQTRRYKQSLEYFNKSIELNPYNINAYYNRAACFIIMKQKDSACKDFRTLIQLQQKKAEGLYEKYCGK